MKLDWMILANAADVHDGLVSMVGGGWDSINPGLTSGLPGQPAAVIKGCVIIRLLLNRAETGREHAFQLKVVDEDGKDIAAVDGTFSAELNPGLPAGWEQNVAVSFDLTGLPLPRSGHYEIALFIDAQYLGGRQFRVMPGGAGGLPPGLPPGAVIR